jgi:hypothetical protein
MCLLEMGKFPFDLIFLQRHGVFFCDFLDTLGKRLAWEGLDEAQDPLVKPRLSVQDLKIDEEGGDLVALY